MAINFEGLPSIDNAEFQSYIKRPSCASDNFKQNPQQTGDDVFHQFDRKQRSVYGSSSERGITSCYASFGDSGTTATVNAYGTIMRLSKYLGEKNSPSQMFGLEHSGGIHPYHVTLRPELFQSSLPFSNSGFGLQIMDRDALILGVPKLEFFNNRWPQIKYSSDGFDVRVRLFCQKGTVIQNFTVTNTLTSAAVLKLILAVDFKMHDLDYMDLHMTSTEYEHGPHGHSVLVLEKTPKSESEDGTSEQMGVLVGLFRNGESEKLLLDLSARPAAKIMQYSLQGNETLELTAAFRLQYLKRSSVWKDFILPISDVDVSKIIQEPEIALDRWPFLRDEISGWHLRRNLEHILSVCSIPLNRDVLERQKPDDRVVCNTPTKGDKDHRVTPIALTCGDFGDHRVSVLGSFFAFKYLLSMYEQLENRLDGDPAAKSLRLRIHDTCKGHLQWVSELDHDKAFASNFWVDGKAVRQNENTDIPTDIPPDSPANMPTHILKVTEFLTVFNKPKEFSFVSEWLPSFIKSWFRNLMNSKNHLTTTWRHLSDRPGIATYRLSDHVWIWRALQSIEKLISDVEENSSLDRADVESILNLRDFLPGRRNRGDGPGLKLEFTAEKLRKQILQKFTLENSISKKRMLSVTRSAQETRFLFHSRDTVLYYGLEWGFFGDDSNPVSELWVRLAESQLQHDEENDEMEWDNPLRYALAILMGMEGHRLDQNYSASDMASRAKQVLLDSSSENGLFPGQLNKLTKEPELFDRELFLDFYFHVGFEIPYVLLRTELKRESRDGEQGRLESEPGVKTSKHGKKAKRRGATLPSRSPIRDPQPKHQPIRPPSMAQISPIISRIDRFQSQLEPSDNRDLAAIKESARIQIVRLKRRIPFGEYVDLSNLVEISEEWLYDYPRFLNFEPPKVEDFATILDKADGIVLQKYIKEKTPKYLSGELIIDRFGGLIQDRSDFESQPVEFTIIDVPKGKKIRKKDDPGPSKNTYSGDLKHSEFWTKLKDKRTAKGAKKRLIYLGRGDGRVAALCYLTSPEMEREHISQFFDRHKNLREFIADNTIAAANFWETEMHIRFYQLVKCEPIKRDSSAMCVVKSNKYSALGEDVLISEAVISFRIVGDFIDRYWTCHIIGNFSKGNDSNDKDFGTFSVEEHWQQRKVLELILFERILSKTRQGSHDIIHAIENGGAKKTPKKAPKRTNIGEIHPFDSLPFEDRSMGNLQEIFQILFNLRNNLASIFEIIETWEVRESTRGQERPRWTRSDEQKYRQSIRKCSALQERNIRDLKNLQARIELLITLVTSAQEAIRSDRALREAENVRLFTYVTVFFLPLGLSSSLFGMGQIPERKVIVTMIITTLIAFIVTFLVLYFTFSEKFAARAEEILHKPMTKALRERLKLMMKGSQKRTVGDDLETGSRPNVNAVGQDLPVAQEKSREEQ